MKVKKFVKLFLGIFSGVSASVAFGGKMGGRREWSWWALVWYIQWVGKEAG